MSALVGKSSNRCNGARIRLGLLSTVGLALIWPSPARGSAPCTERLTVDWTFHAAAPLSGEPAVSKENWVIVSSVDGYVHALAPQGRFQWSYTLDSPPAGITVGGDGRTYALSQQGVLHVMLTEGRRQWGSRLPAGMLPTGPVRQNQDGMVFVPSQLNLYAFSQGGGLAWRAFLGSNIVSGPLVTPRGRVWVATQDGRVARIETPQKRLSFRVPDAPSIELVAGDDDLVLARLVPDGASTLVAFDEEGHERWQLPDVVRVSADGTLVERRGGTWGWIDPKTGRQLGERAVAVTASTAPATLGRHAVVPGTDGRVYVFDEKGAVEWCQIATAPLLRPQVSKDSGQVTAASGDGWVAAVRFRDQPKASSSNEKKQRRPR
jgi:outer membrane protein assembly factor BamB